MNTLPTDLIFWLLAPALVTILVFALVVYLGRGRRRTVVSLTGLGVRLVLESHPPESERGMNAEQ